MTDNRPIDLNEMVRLLSACREVRNDLSRRDLTYLNALAARPGDPYLLRSVTARIAIRMARQALSLDPFPAPPPMHGVFLLGYHRNGEARAGIGGTHGHELLAMSTGGGKTSTACFQVTASFVDLAAVWLFDFYKRELRRLRRHLRRRGKTLHVLSWRQFSVNILAPPDPRIPPDEWANILADVLERALRLPPASRNLLLTSIHDLFRSAGVVAGSVEYPTLWDLRRTVADSDAPAALRGAILNRLDAVLAELGNAVKHTRRGLPVAKLCEQAVVFELDGISFFSQNLITTYLVAALFAYRIRCPESERKGPVVVVLDEAVRLFSRSLDSGLDDGQSYLSSMVALVRGAKVFLVIIVQMLGDLSRSVLANCTTKIMGPLGDPHDADLMGRSMGMAPAQVEACKRLLRPGLYAASVAGGTFRDPFLITIPHFTLDEDVSDAEAWESGEELWRQVMPRPDNQPGAQESPPRLLPAPSAPLATDDERAFLRLVLEHPYLPSARYPEMQRIGKAKAGNLRRSLVANGYLREWSVELTQRGRKTVLLEVIRDPDSGRPLGGHPGRGGNFIHRLGVSLARTKYEAEGYGFRTEESLTGDGGRVDVDLFGVRPDTGDNLAIQVETDSVYAVETLPRALRIGFDRLVVVAADRSVRDAIADKISAVVPASQLEGVLFSTLSDYWTNT